MQPTSPQMHAADEISLQELIITLWKAKRLILLITLIITALAVVYALFWPPTYEAKAQTLPPTPSGLASYNMAHQLSGPALTTIIGNAASENNVSNPQSDNSVPELTPDDAYKVFIRHLKSVALRQRFFHKIYLPAHPHIKNDEARERLWRKLNNELVIESPKPKASQEQIETITFEGRDPKRIASWTNLYLKMAIQASQDQLLDSLTSAIGLRLHSVDDQIQTLRNIARTTRQNEIVRLKNALTIAKTINLENPPSTGNLITSYTGTTMYLRGAKALQAELNLLESRVSDDPYIPQLSSLLKEEALLKKIDLNPEHLSVAIIDQPATPPEFPIWPKKLLIVILGVIIGLLIGIMVALMGKIWQRSSTN